MEHPIKRLLLLLSGHQALDIPSVASFQKYDEGIQSQIEVDDRLWTSNTSFVARLFENGECFC